MPHATRNDDGSSTYRGADITRSIGGYWMVPAISGTYRHSATSEK